MIDDDPALRRLIRILGREIGIDVVVASNGEEGLELVQAEQPDAIVLDLVMPVMDGRRFYSELRARNIDTPVLILSAYSARTAKHELRAEAYLEKPFEPEELLAGIQRLVK